MPLNDDMVLAYDKMVPVVYEKQTKPNKTIKKKTEQKQKQKNKKQKKNKKKTRNKTNQNKTKIVICKQRTLNDGGEDSVKYRNGKNCTAS